MGPDALAQVLCHLPKFSDPNLLVGFDTSDDASVYRISDELALVQTVDIFPPAVDDAYEYGKIAAANSISDVYAMGGVPKLAMNIFCFPEDLPTDTLQAILQGGYEKVAEAGAIITGGHTIKDKEPKYGLCVTGFVHPDKVLRNDAIRPGELLILTKPIGTGVLTTAARGDLLSPEELKAAISSMETLNKYAADIMLKYPVSACTDVTGFGLLGHAAEMAAPKGLSICIDSASVPLLPGAMDNAAMGIVPAATYKNREYLSDLVSFAPTVSETMTDLLFDPQTSGGLLISLPEKDAEALLREMNETIPAARIIGRVEEYKGYPLLIE